MTGSIAPSLNLSTIKDNGRIYAYIGDYISHSIRTDHMSITSLPKAELTQTAQWNGPHCTSVTLESTHFSLEITHPIGDSTVRTSIYSKDGSTKPSVDGISDRRRIVRYDVQPDQPIIWAIDEPYEQEHIKGITFAINHLQFIQGAEKSLIDDLERVSNGTKLIKDVGGQFFFNLGSRMRKTRPYRVKEVESLIRERLELNQMVQANAYLWQVQAQRKGKSVICLAEAVCTVAMAEPYNISAYENPPLAYDGRTRLECLIDTMIVYVSNSYHTLYEDIPREAALLHRSISNPRRNFQSETEILHASFHLVISGYHTCRVSVKVSSHMSKLVVAVMDDSKHVFPNNKDKRISGHEKAREFVLYQSAGSCSILGAVVILKACTGNTRYL